QSELEVIGAVASKNEALALANDCDVMVVSAALPEGGALELIQALERQPNAPATVVIGLPDTESLLIRYLEAGAAGCIREQDSCEELVNTIRTAAASEIALTSDLFHAVLTRVHQLVQENPAANSADSKD